MKNAKLFFLSLFFLASTAHAFSFGVDPSHLNFKTKPGETSIQQLTLVNYGKEPMQLSLSIEEWKLLPDGAKEFGRPGLSVFGCGAWIKVEPQTITLPAQGKTQVTVLMLTPTDSVGGHQAVVFAQNIPSLKDDKPGRVPLVGKVGTLIFQDTDGATDAKFSVKQAGLDMDTRSQTLHLTVKNEGNTYVACSGYAMILREESGAVIDRQTLPKWPLLPGDSNKADVVFNKQPLPAGKYLFLVTVESEGLDPVVVEEAFTL